MATTISSEGSTTSTAPRIFHISSSSDSSNVQKCPLCKKFRKYFYCKDCVQRGHISSSRNNENYINLKRVLAELEESKQMLARESQKQLDIYEQKDVLQRKIRQSKERSRLIQLDIEERRLKKNSLNTKFSDLCERNRERRDKLKAYKTKSEALEDWVAKKREDVILAQEKLLSKHEEVKKLARLRVQQLFKYIFPISLVKQPAFELDSSGDSILREIAEASQTTYIRDKWVYTDYNEMQYCIVAPCLPASSYYSGYNIWAQNHDGIPVSEETESADMHPSYSISAALTFTAQLVNVLSFFLDIRLPFKMIYSEFSNSNMTEQQFARRVARMNANILYLCITQNIDLSALRANATIHNILQLKDNDTADLGRQGPLDVNDKHVTALEKAIPTDLRSSDDSDSDEGDSLNWEAVPHVQCPEVAAGAATVQSQVINTQQASSMAGGLVNSAVASVASIFRGFNWR